jgi:hypothetical protein
MTQEPRFVASATPPLSRLFQGTRDAYTPCAARRRVEPRDNGGHTMNWKSKLALGVLTALAMMFLTYALPRGGTMRDAAVVQFPVTVGVWAIFVLLFVKLK